MPVRDEDLTTTARIRNAALAGFAEEGPGETTIRDVARAAGVSPGLVQHHFGTKARLQEAVNAYVVELIAAEVEQLDLTLPPARLFEQIGERITAFVRDNRHAVLYIGRSASAGEAAGLGIFDSLIALIGAQVERLAEEGFLAPDLDRLWTVLHIIVLNLGTVLFETAIERHLDAPFRDPEQLERWNRATTSLFTRRVTPE